MPGPAVQSRQAPPWGWAGKGPGEAESAGPPLLAWGLLTSVCLLLAFFLESFRPVLLRSLQGSPSGQRLEAWWVLTTAGCAWTLAGCPPFTPGDQVTQVCAGRPGPTRGGVPSGGQHRSHSQWDLVRWRLSQSPEAGPG